MDQRPQNFMCVTWTRFSPWQSLIDLVGEVGAERAPISVGFMSMMWHRFAKSVGCPPHRTPAFLPFLPASLLLRSFSSPFPPFLYFFLHPFPPSLGLCPSLFLFHLHCESESGVAQSCPTLCDPMDSSLQQALCPWDFLGKSTEVGCHFLLQGIFPTQASNPGLPHCRQMLYHLSHQGSPIFIVFDCKHGTLEYAVA